MERVVGTSMKMTMVTSLMNEGWTTTESRHEPTHSAISRRSRPAPVRQPERIAAESAGTAMPSYCIQVDRQITLR